ncbi:ester cyclase [Sphingomonas sp. SRS2]|uniref:ester cyclase n=1 Tax=Sphingomonas sp. SRS2 TaxID=133190 RepID=UPI000ABE816A|nr:ester cyclase [Sphingomonas sp. SRS2]
MSDYSTTSDAARQVRTTLDTFYRAFAGEPDLLDDVVTSDWQDIPLLPGQGGGPEGIKPMIRAFRQAIPDLAITVHSVIADGDQVGVRAAMTGTHTGEWFGAAPTGRAFTITLHEFHRIENGRLTHTWHLEDWFGWLNQIGAWPADKKDAS